MLAAPVLFEQILTLSVSYTDWWLTARYFDGAAPRAAMTVAGYVGWLLPSLFAAISIGATALVSRRVGAGSIKGAALIANQAALLGVILAAIITLAFALGSTSLVAVLGLAGESADLAIRYFTILTPAIPAIMVSEVAVACLRGAGDTVTGFIAKTIVNFVNILVSSTLVVWGEAWGISPWSGIAIGTAVAHWTGAILLFAVLVRGRSGLFLRWRWMRPHRRSLRRLLVIGVPGGFDILAILFCHFVYLGIINTLGDAAAAAHGLGVQIEGLAYMPGAAFQVAAATLCGQNLGAGRPDRAVRSVVTALSAGMFVMGAAAVAFFFAGGWLAALFTGDVADPTVQQTGDLLRIGALAIVPLSIAMVLSGALRGAGDTRLLMVITLIGFVGLRIPLACFLAWNEVPVPLSSYVITGWGMGVFGAWWAMFAEVLLRSVMIGFRFWQGRWKTLRV